MLAAGALIAGRFAIEGLLGAGGMGRVYRAIDRETGRPVALKVMLDAEPSATDAARFAVEARALSELDHPGIVAHVAHGTTIEGLPFLAMELLDGEDLGARLRRGPLSVTEGLLLLRRAASALDEAHRRGIVHRDLKPSNIFLRDREIDRLAIVDFGIARRMMASRALTASAALVGTPGYMAPEQVEGARDLSAAADVFALGCVLYEGLTGQAPFLADHLVALLAKILLDEPPPLRSIAPSVPAALADLVARMMAKAPVDRPADAAAVLDALARIEAMRAGEPPEEGAPRVDRAPPIALGRGELELVTVILASHRPRGDDRTLDEDVHTMAARVEAAARPELSARGAVVERLLDGSLLVTLGEASGSAVDQAVEAAHCAWVLRSRWPEATVAVATARRPAGARIPVGEAIDRASRIGRHGDRTPSGIVLDEITAGLLGGRLRVVALDDGLATMVDAPAPLDEERPLLGKPTPCVGREAELGTLEVALRACLDESSPRAVLVLGPPGLGKSRLRHELLRRVDQQGAEAPLRLLGRGELLRAGTPYGILGRALRRFFGITAELPPAEGRALIARGIEAIVPAGEQRSVAEMLGELCDMPFPDDDSVRLRAARQDPRLMQAHLGEAFVAFLRGASRRGVMIVLEDLHWGDRASIELCDRALRQLDDRPLFLVGFARPEVHALTPPSWKDRVIELPLRPLGKRACTRLVEGVAGDRLDAATIARVVEQSGGNALFLEELVRAACDEGPAAIPETVVAMLQARIGRLDPAERRLLRAASIFGESFDRAGVGAVLGPSVAEDDIERLFAALCREELIAPQRDEPGRYRFRHALLREAAYGLLPEDDRRVGHHLAARWLSTGEPDPAPIAEHYLLAGEPAEAAPWFVRAADRAMVREDYEAATRFARRARTEGAGGELRGVLSAIEGFTAIMRVDWPAARAAAEEAEALLLPGSLHWCMAQRTISQVRAYLDDLPALVACIERFLAVDPGPEARIAYADTALFIASSSVQVGLTRQGAALIARSEAAAGAEIARYPALAAWSNVIHCTLHRHTDDALGAQIRRLNDAFRLYAETGAPTVIL
ncbi:MAG: protein kinase, partial [Byssovorax sp.]